LTGNGILVVDDNESNLRLVTLLLQGRGYEVRTAVDARRALEVLEGFRPRLILLDIQLPDVDGLELTRRLKADPKTREIAIVAVSAYAMQRDHEKARAAGADGYISKPIDKDSFRQTVAAYLSGGRNDGPAADR
jgi:two-component system cell cycle response regulator DivK